MNWIKNLSIKNKLISIILTVVIFTAVFGIIFSVAEKIYYTKKSLSDNSIMNAKIISQFCVTALYFQRPDAADDALKKLETVSYVLNARVYDNDGKIFSEYNRVNFNEDLFKKYPVKGLSSIFEKDYLIVALPLIYNDKTYGMLYLRSSLESLNEEIQEYIKFNIILGIFIFIISYMLALQLQKFISRPIIHLAEVTKEITEKGNFNLRVQKEGKDEISMLYDEFNYMLEQIQLHSGQRDQALEKIKINEERLKLALEGANDGLWDWNIKSGEVYFSKRWKAMLGYKNNEIEGNFTSWEKLVHPDDHLLVMNKLDEHLKGKTTQYDTEYRLQTKNGDWVWILDRGKVVEWDGDGSPLRMVGTHTDITERKKVEEELLVAKEKAEMSDRFKSEFLAQMSHEIRSPINVILSFTSLLKDELKDKIDAELAGSFESIDNGGRRIIRTIDMILNMSEIQTGIVEIRPVKLNLYTDILQNLVLEYKSSAKSKGLDLTLRNEVTDRPVIHADEYSVTQIFSNLIDNAIKYTRKGGIEVSIFKNGGDKLSVKVSDTGIGISEEYIPQIFNAFTQEETGYTRKFEGNGLGLALVKRYCDLNNIDIKVESKKGEGSKFIVTFNY